MILRDKVTYAWSDLKGRSSAWTVSATMFVAALSVLLLSFYGFGVREYLDRRASGDLLGRVAVDLPTGAAAISGGLQNKLLDWQKMDAVESAWPRIEVTVDAIYGECRMPSVPVEGVDSSDPILESKRMAWGEGWTPGDRNAVIVSQRFLMKLGGHLAAAGPSIPTVRLELRRQVDQKTESQSVELKILGVLADTARSSAARDTLIVPIGLTRELDRWLTRRSSVLQAVSQSGYLESFPAGATLYARQDKLELLAQDLAQLKADAVPEVVLEVADFAGAAWVGISGPGMKIPTELDKVRWGTDQVWTSIVPVAVGDGEEMLVAGIKADDPRWGAKLVVDQHRNKRAAAPWKRIPWLRDLNGAELAPLAGVGADVVMPISNLATLFWYTGETPPKRWRRDFLIEEAHELHAVVREAERRGWTVELLTAVEQVKLVAHRLKDLDSESIELKTDLINQVNMARASVFAVIPNCATSCIVNKTVMQAVGTLPHDPRRLDSMSVYGRWIAAGASREIVLPLAWCRRDGFVSNPNNWLDAKVQLQVPQGGDSFANVPFTVVGFSEEDSAFMRVDDIQSLNACRAEILSYDTSENRFVDPAITKLGGGATRATVITTDVDGLRDFIAKVEPAGFVVHHRLSELERARELGDTIALFALALAACAVFGGALTSWNVTKVYLKSKIREVAILRSLGLAPKAIGRVFGIQGLMLGCPAFALALIVAFVLEPLLSELVGAAIGASSGDAFAERLLSLGNVPLYVLGCAVSVGFGSYASYQVARSAATKPLAAALSPATE